MITPEQQAKINSYLKTSGYTPPTPVNSTKSTGSSWYDAVQKESNKPQPKPILNPAERILTSTNIGRSLSTKSQDTTADIKQIGTDIKLSKLKRRENIAESIEAMNSGEQGYLRTTLQTAGQFGGFAADALGAGIKGLIKGALPQKGEEIVKNTVNSVISPIISSDTAQAIMTKYDEIKDTNPALARDVSAALGAVDLLSNFIGLGEVKKATTAAIEATQAATKVAAETVDVATTNFIKQAENNFNKKLLSEFKKGVKPSIAGKKSLGQIDNYDNNVVNAVRTIKENQPNLKFTDEVGTELVGETPKTLQQFSESIDQTKKTIYDRYNALAIQAGDKGLSVDLKPIVNELDTVINNKALSLTNPKAVEYAALAKKRYQAFDNLDAETAQQVIQNYNKSLEAFYKNPNYETASNAAIDAMIANRIRQSLDEGITGLTGEAYGALKKQYGSLKAIEQDVLRAAMREAKRDGKGLIDYTDIFSGGDIVNGILTMSPGLIAKGATQKAIASFYKYLKNPNRAIENIFKTVDQVPLKAKLSKGLSDFIKNPKLGASISSISPANYESAEDFVKAQGDTVFRGGQPLDISKINEEGLPVSLNKKVAEQFALSKNQFAESPAGQIMGYKKGQNIVETYRISPNAKIATRADIPDDVYAAYKQARPSTNPGVAEPIVNNWAKKNGFDAIDFRTLGTISAEEAEIKILNSEILRTESQLTDIWNKANKK